jgi:hypothetical protein
MDAVMEESSHLNLMTMALLQTCGYIIDQMQTEVTVDINKFLEAFSIEGESGRIQPPSWTKGEDNSVVIVPNTPATPPQPEHDSSTSATFNMDDYRKCRQAEALRWIDLQEKRSSIISRLQPISAEEYQRLRNLVLSKPGPLLRKSKKKTGLKYAAFIDLLS